MTTNKSGTTAKTFEWWMVAMFAVGLAYSAFVSLLIPPFISSLSGGSASTAGVVMAIIALGALAGPPIGGFADKYGAHRLVMVAGVAAMALAFVAFALTADNSELYALDAILMGVGVAGVSATAPVLIVGARLSQEAEAKQMTTLQLMMPAGQLVGGAILAAATAWSFADRFWLGAGIVAVLTVIVWFTSAGPGERLEAAIEITESEAARTQQLRKASLKQVFISGFGIYIAVMVLSSVANNGVNSQISNILPNVYGIDQQTTSALISLAGLLNIILYFPAGRWMAKRGAFPPYAAGIVARLVAGLGMALVGMMSGNQVLLGAAFMQLMYQAAPFTRLPQTSLAVRMADFPAGIASGWVIAASAVGAFLGSLIGGFLADKYGFNAINWMAAVSAAASVVVLWFWLRPREANRRHAEEAATAARDSAAPVAEG
jgi:predicted MFS family arabinose efflux permease